MSTTRCIIKFPARRSTPRGTKFSLGTNISISMSDEVCSSMTLTSPVLSISAHDTTVLDVTAGRDTRANETAYVSVETESSHYVIIRGASPFVLEVLYSCIVPVSSIVILLFQMLAPTCHEDITLSLPPQLRYGFE